MARRIRKDATLYSVSYFQWDSDMVRPHTFALREGECRAVFVRKLRFRIEGGLVCVENLRRRDCLRRFPSDLYDVGVVLKADGGKAHMEAGTFDRFEIGSHAPTSDGLMHYYRLRWCPKVDRENRSRNMAAFKRFMANRTSPRV